MIDEHLFLVFRYQVIKYMSLAMNKLQRIPEQILALVSVSLQYLSLAGNNFATIFEEHETSFRECLSIVVRGSFDF